MSKHAKNEARDVGRIATALEAAVPTSRARDTSRPIGDERLPIGARLRLWFGTTANTASVARGRRRSYPIVGYVGPNGGGKSLAMVHDTLPSLAAGRRVLSTVRILDAATGEPHPLYVPFTDFDQLLDARECDVLMDEVVGIASSRESAKLPAPVQNILVQLRRRDVVLRWTAPNWARADKIIREVTQAVVECRGYFPGKPTPAADGSSLRLWAPKRVFSFSLFDTMDFEEWTTGKRDRLDPLSREWFKGVGSLAFSSYDTMDAVSMVSHADSEQQCSICGHRKKVRYCGCDAHVSSVGVPLLDRALLVGEDDERPAFESPAVHG